MSGITVLVVMAVLLIPLIVVGAQMVAKAQIEYHKTEEAGLAQSDAVPNQGTQVNS